MGQSMPSGVSYKDILTSEVLQASPFRMILTVALAALFGLSAALPHQFLHSRCHENGQILPDKHGNTCQFQVCDYGDEPWVDEHGKIRFLEVTFSCPKGTSTNPHKFNPEHPCEVTTDKCGIHKFPVHPFIHFPIHHKFPVHPIHPVHKLPVHVPVHPVHPIVHPVHPIHPIVHKPIHVPVHKPVHVPVHKPVHVP